ncbi:MAG TPA: hypothetical protein VLM39_11245 [Ignavibacteriaceae bacterium]|nr:hypothetical protein [Ignavibacteriaceae bacterium]
MKNYFIFSITVLLLVFTGCIEVKTLITVNKDGSGTIEETMVMSEQVVEMMKGFSAAFTSDSTQQQDFNIFDENNLKERAGSLGKGVTYVSGEKIEEGNKKGFRALYAFKNLDDISLKKIPQNDIPLNITEVAGSDLIFKFKKGSPSEIFISFPEMEDSASSSEEWTDSTDEFDSPDSSGDSTFTQEALDLMKDLSISLIMRTNGPIVESNAAYVEGPEVTLFQLDFNKLLDSKEDLQELFKLKSRNMEKIKDLLKNIPGIKIETSKEIFIKFN